MKLIIKIARYVYHTVNRLEKKRKLNLKEESIDFENIHKSFYKASKLHRELIAISHPDKFSDDKQKDFATNIAAQINANKYNYKELIKLQSIINNNLKK